MTLVLRYAARSDRGLVRQNNQDSVYAGPRLLALADGMGGHAAGEVASKVVIAALASLDDDDPGGDLLNELGEAIEQGNAAISELVGGDPDLDGMGTTLTAVLFAGSKLGLAHIGDSRAYLLRNGAFAQITHDDTFVQSLIDEGRITAEEAASHPQRSLLLKALTGRDIDPSLAVREARAGDRYLLCSDGLSGVVSDETLAETLKIQDPQACADRLIELALKGGGPDNVTVIVADVVDVDFGQDAPIVGGAAGDGAEDPMPPDSAAARASATTMPRPRPKPTEPASAPDPGARRRRRVRVLLVSIVVLAMVFAGALAGRVLLFRYYYVGESDGQVVIYRGLKDTVLGIPMHRVYESACPEPSDAGCEPIPLSDLQETAQLRVREGFEEVDSLEKARADVRRLRTEQLLPPCPRGDETTTQPTTPSVPTTTPSVPTTTASVPTTTGVPPTGTVPTGEPPAASGGVIQPPGTTSSTQPPAQQVPGKDCRQVG
ncbi:MAG TPA: PP2C family serine/threonine-protein phosphatase [Pseudonocardiaceae bacterium]